MNTKNIKMVVYTLAFNYCLLHKLWFLRPLSVGRVFAVVKIHCILFAYSCLAPPDNCSYQQNTAQARHSSRILAV